jgi:hypothetical protein
MTHASDTPTGEHSAVDPVEALLYATNRLSDNVEALSENLTVQYKQSRRLRRVAVAVLGVVVLVLGIGWYAVSANSKTLVQACENANETRAANMALWTTVLGSVQKSSPDPNKWVDELLDWIAVLYQPHDCDHLDRVYDVPPPPDFGKAR